MSDEDKRLHGLFASQGRDGFMGAISSVTPVFTAAVLEKSPIVLLSAPANLAKSLAVGVIAGDIVEDPTLTDPSTHSFMETRPNEATDSFVYDLRETPDGRKIAFQFTNSLQGGMVATNYTKMREDIERIFPQADGYLTFIAAAIPKREHDVPDLSIYYTRVSVDQWGFEGEIRANQDLFGEENTRRVLDSAHVRPYQYPGS